MSATLGRRCFGRVEANAGCDVSSLTTRNVLCPSAEYAVDRLPDTVERLLGEAATSCNLLPARRGCYRAVEAARKRNPRLAVPSCHGRLNRLKRI